MTPLHSLAVVDDESSIREGIAMALGATYDVRPFASAEEALVGIGAAPPDLVLLDIGLPGMNGIEALGRIKALSPSILVVMITAFEDVETVVAAMRQGAYDYVVKPLHMDNLRVIIQHGLETVRLKKEVHALQEERLKEIIPFFIGASHAIQGVMEFVEQVAQSPDTPVLIQGETGTGKELVASAIHYRSPNFRGELVTVNCAAIPRDLVESELFGYEEGAFSGAKVSGKQGLIDQAAHGTLFLDEVGDLSLEAQAKLLRFVEAGEFYRVGGTRKVRISTRVVSATNRDLEQMISANLFRRDLYFRLGVIRVDVPSLNQRREDILPLAERFRALYSAKFGKSVTGFSPAAAEALLAHDWEGNVRELKNLVERAVLIGRGPLVDELTLGLTGSGSQSQSVVLARGLSPLTGQGVDLAELLKSVERFYIQEALRLADHNESQAARLLGMNHHTFRYHRKNL